MPAERSARPAPSTSAASLAAYVPLLEGRTSGRIEAPGQLRSHYAPAKPLRLDAASGGADEWMIGFGATQGDDNLSPAGDLAEAAARLFEALHRADRQDRPRIAVASVPAEGIGLAINDRLRRAAAPRSEG
jgi:L-threonylcarbamoyladenylate synthase